IEDWAANDSDRAGQATDGANDAMQHDQSWNDEANAAFTDHGQDEPVFRDFLDRVEQQAEELGEDHHDDPLAEYMDTAEGQTEFDYEGDPLSAEDGVEGSETVAS